MTRPDVKQVNSRQTFLFLFGKFSLGKSNLMLTPVSSCPTCSQVALRVVRAKAQSFPAGDVSVLVHRASKSAIWITCTFCTFHSGIPLCNLRWSISSPNVKQLAFQILTIFLPSEDGQELQVRLRGGKYSTNCCTISVGVLRQCSAAYSVAGVMYVTCGCTCGGAQCAGEET